MHRQIVLDTETTGLDPANGDRIIEIGCVELIDRTLTGEKFHIYLNPDQRLSAESTAIHGIKDEDLLDKPRFSEIAQDFYKFIQGSELVIHNAEFDLKFINSEFSRLKDSYPTIQDICPILDTLKIARKKYPGQKNNLNALCKRLHIDNSKRVFHGALLDAEILAELYLAMTGGQTSLAFAETPKSTENAPSVKTDYSLTVIRADTAELKAHHAWLERLRAQGQCLWDTVEKSIQVGNEKKTNQG